MTVEDYLSQWWMVQEQPLPPLLLLDLIDRELPSTHRLCPVEYFGINKKTLSWSARYKLSVVRVDMVSHQIHINILWYCNIYIAKNTNCGYLDFFNYFIKHLNCQDDPTVLGSNVNSIYKILVHVLKVMNAFIPPEYFLRGIRTLYTYIN